MIDFVKKVIKFLPQTIIIIMIIIIIVRCAQIVVKKADSNPVAKMFDYSNDAIEDKSFAENKTNNEKSENSEKSKNGKKSENGEIVIFEEVKIQNSDGLVWVSGFRDANDIADEIRFHIVSMKYKFHLQKIYPPEQKVIVKVSIDKYGRVSNPQIISPDTLSQNSRDLILSDLKTWQFVQIKQEGETAASFPLNLKNRLNQSQ